MHSCCKERNLNQMLEKPFVTVRIIKQKERLIN